MVKQIIDGVIIGATGVGGNDVNAFDGGSFGDIYSDTVDFDGGAF